MSAGLLLLVTKEGQVIKNAVLDLSKSTSTLELEAVDDKNKPVVSVQFTMSVKVPSQRVLLVNLLSNSVLQLKDQNGIFQLNKLPVGQFHIQLYSEQLRSIKHADVELFENKTTKCKVQFGQ